MILACFESSWDDDIHADNHFEQLGDDLVSRTTVSRLEVLVDVEESLCWRIKLEFHFLGDLKLEDDVRVLGVSLSQRFVESKDERVVDVVVVWEQEGFDYVLEENLVVEGVAVELHVVHVEVCGVLASWHDEVELVDSANEFSHVLVEFGVLADLFFECLGESHVVSSSFLVLIFFGGWGVSFVPWKTLWDEESDITQDVVSVVEVFERDVEFYFVSSEEMGVFNAREVDAEDFVV
jgi:hypothetical protein